MRNGMEARRDRRCRALERLLERKKQTEKSINEIHRLQTLLGEPLTTAFITVFSEESSRRAVEEGSVVSSAAKIKKVRKPKRTTERKQVR